MSKKKKRNYPTKHTGVAGQSGGGGLTFQAIGELMGFSDEMARKIFTRGMAKVRLALVQRDDLRAA